MTESRRVGFPDGQFLANGVDEQSSLELADQTRQGAGGRGQGAWGSFGVSCHLGFKPLTLVMKKKKYVFRDAQCKGILRPSYKPLHSWMRYSPLLPAPCPLPLVDCWKQGSHEKAVEIIASLPEKVQPVAERIYERCKQILPREGMHE